MSETNNGSAWGLVIAVLVGAIAMGLYAYPEYQDIDKVLDLIRKETTAYAKEVSDFVKTKPRYVAAPDTKKATTTKYLKIDPSGVEVDSKSSKKKQSVDRLNKGDRKQLNDLLSEM